MVLNADIIRDLRKEYGEAFYLFDPEQFRENFLTLKEAFSNVYSNFNIAYSYKTNYMPRLCKLVNELGGYAEVVSEMELELARRIHVIPAHIIWNGPVKSISAVYQLLMDGGCVNVDSISEMRQIVQIADRYVNMPLHVGIRCNFDIGDGVISRFGLDIEGDDFREALDLISKHRNIQLVSFQCHFAKRQIDYWKARAEGILKIIRTTGLIPERIDLGGGIFGHMDESLKKQFPMKIPSYEEYAIEAAAVLEGYFAGVGNKPELVIEPGSALVGDCMKFVGTVKTIKNIRGKYFASVYGSQKNIGMSGLNPPMEVIHMGGDRSHYDKLDMVGYTCIEGDVLYRDYDGELAEDDVVVISNCGSYSVVMKPPFILPNFPVLDINGGNVSIIKNAEIFDDIFHTYCY